MDKLNHWRYFLSLEADLVDTLRYVEHTAEQKGVYSFEFARLLMLTCAEIEVVLKVACREFAGAEFPESINQLAQVIG